MSKKSRISKRYGLSALALIAAIGLGAGCAADATYSNNGGGRNGAPDASPDGISQLDAGDAAQDADQTAPDGGEDDGGATDSGAPDADEMDAAVDATTDAADATDATDAANTTDAGNDTADAADTADATDADAADAADTTPQPKGCTGIATTGTRYQLDPSGLAGQLYSSAAFDGQGIWVSYATPESAGAGDEDVWALRLMCDGTVGAGPLKLNTTASGAGLREYQPRIDVENGTVYVVWVAEDTNTGVKTIAYRTYNTDGTPIMNAEADITPQDTNGDAVSDMIWEPDVAGLPGGGAVMVASYGNGTRFQIAAQPVDDNGNRNGSYFDVYSTVEADQKKPIVTAESGTKLWVSWTSSAGFTGPHKVVYRDVDPTNPTQVAPVQVGTPSQPVQTVGSAVASPIAQPQSGGGEVFVASTSDAYRIHVSAGGAASADDITMGGPSPSGYYLYSGIAAGQGGGAVAWYSGATPTKLTLSVQPFSYGASSGLSAGSVTSIALSDAAYYARQPYGPSILNVGAGLYFVMWSDGPRTNEGRLYGQFIQP